jgi:pSer/pThr/pTyr-binding forkhead associated (FHA) protein
VYRGTEIILGRDPTCDIPLMSETVSARHARFSFHHAQWWLEDLKSTNGTFLNEEAVITSVVIKTGDQIRCGDIYIKIVEAKEHG